MDEYLRYLIVVPAHTAVGLKSYVITEKEWERARKLTGTTTHTTHTAAYRRILVPFPRITAIVIWHGKDRR